MNDDPGVLERVAGRGERLTRRGLEARLPGLGPAHGLITPAPFRVRMHAARGGAA